MHKTQILDTLHSADDLVGQIDDALFAAAQTGSFPFRYIESNLQAEDVDVHIWQGPHEGDQVRIVEDQFIDAVYAVIQSDNDRIISDVQKALDDKVGVLGCSDLCRSIRESITVHPERLIQLTLCNSKAYHAPSEALLISASKIDNDRIRSNAVQAMSMLRWPKLELRLQDMRIAEKSPEIARMIEFALTQQQDA